MKFAVLRTSFPRTAAAFQAAATIRRRPPPPMFRKKGTALIVKPSPWPLWLGRLDPRPRANHHPPLGIYPRNCAISSAWLQTRKAKDQVEGHEQSDRAESGNYE